MSSDAIRARLDEMQSWPPASMHAMNQRVELFDALRAVLDLLDARDDGWVDGARVRSRIAAALGVVSAGGAPSE